MTIHDVAAAAGVSIKTVSRVIRDEPKASEATRQAVREAIRRLGYVPHAVASALSSSVTPVVGLLSIGFSEPSMRRAGYEYRMCLQVGAFNACQAAGFGLSLVLQHGHRRIAFIRGNAGWRDSEHRYAGYVDAMTAAGLPLDPALVAQGLFSFDAGRQCAQHLLALPRPPTAIIASSDDIAAGAIAVARERGLDLPADLSVTGYDDTDMARKLWPALTTVHQPVEQMAEEATRRLLALMRPSRHGAATGPAQLELRSELVLRASLTAPGKARR